MGISDETVPPEPPAGAEVDEIQADIEDTREALGRTVASLAEKLDVKARAGQRIAHMKQAANDEIHTLQENVSRHRGLVAAALTATVALPLASWRRRQKS
jgi:Protein of unknown function (DUF3618)